MYCFFFPVAEHPLITLQLNGTDQNAMVICSATGGYPPISNISLLKNGDAIASAVSESTLQVNTADLSPSISHYGLYVCHVNLSGIPLQQSVMLNKKGSYNVTGFADLKVLVMTLLSSLCISDQLQIQLDMNSGSCTVWAVSGMGMRLGHTDS